MIDSFLHFEIGKSVIYSNLIVKNGVEGLESR